MRLLYANNHHQVRGGSDSVYFNTIALIEGAGHEGVAFAARDDHDILSPQAAYFPDAANGSARRPADFCRFLYNREARQAITRLIAERGPFDIAHLHIYYGRLTPAILGPLRRARVPIVQTLHEYKLACPVYTMERGGNTCDACVSGSTLNLLRYRCKDSSFLHSAAMLAEFWTSRLQGDIRHINRFICVSDFQLDVMRRAGLPDTRLRRLHNFVDTERFRLVQSEQRKDYLLYFGRIERLKGLPTLLRAVKATGHLLHIAGTGTWEPELHAAVASHGNISHLGFVSGAALDKLIAEARAVIVPSQWFENCPMSVLEAKAAGTPVVGARIGGIPELIRDGVDGLLFEPGDPNSLAMALTRLDSLDVTAMGRAARADAETRFSPAVHLAGLLEIYGEVLQ